MSSSAQKQEDADLMAALEASKEMSSSSSKKKKKVINYEIVEDDGNEVAITKLDHTLSFFEKWVLRVQKRPTRDELWAREEALDEGQRRARYKCKRYVGADEIERWSSYAKMTLADNMEAHAAYHEEQKRKDERMKEKLRSMGVDVDKKKKAKEPEPISDDSDDEIDAAVDAEGAQKQKKRRERREFRRMLRERSAEEKRLKAIWEEEHKVDMANRDVLFTKNEKLSDKVAVWKGDITSLEVDAIVNAANKSMLGGGGIDGAIHKAAGDMLYVECGYLRGAECGEAKLTRGHCLPAKFVIHTVGPVGKYEDKLVEAYTNCLNVAVDAKVRTLAVCGISSGIYGYPLWSAARVALRTIRQWLEEGDNADKIDLIMFVVFLEKEHECYDTLMPLYFPITDESTSTTTTNEQEVKKKKSSKSKRTKEKH